MKKSLITIAFAVASMPMFAANQAPSQADAEPAENEAEKNSETQEVREAVRRKRRVTMSV